MPTLQPSSAATADCNFALVVPTTLGNLTSIADAIVKSTQLSAKLLSPLPTPWSPVRGNTGLQQQRTFLPSFLLLNSNTSNFSSADNASSLFISSLDDFDLFGVPFASGHTWLHILLATLLVVAIMIIIIFGNALVIIAVHADKSLKGIQNYFIVSLAVADLLVGLTIMPLSLAVELMGKWIFGQIACNLWLGGDVLLCTASILNLCMISIDRYWSVTLAGQYTARVRKHRVTVMIVLVWILSTVISLPPLVGVARKYSADDECELMDDLWYIIYSTCGSFYAPLVVMIVVYIRIFVIARRTARKSAFKLTKQLQKQRHSPSPAPIEIKGLVALSTAGDKNNNNNNNHDHADKAPSAANTADGPLLAKPIENGETANNDTEKNGPGGTAVRDRLQRNDSSKKASMASTGRFRRVLRQVLFVSYFRRPRRSIDDDDDDVFPTASQRQHAKSRSKKGRPFSVNGEPAEDGRGSIINPRMLSSPIMSNDNAIHQASSLLGNVAMSLAVLSPRVSSTRRNSGNSELPKILQSLAEQAPGLQTAIFAPMRTTVTEKPPSSHPLSKTLSEAANDRSASVPMDLSRRASHSKMLTESASRLNLDGCETEEKIKLDSGSGFQQLVALTSNNIKPVKKDNAGVPQLSLAEEVERRKKRLAKERERRTTRILVIIMLSFIGCWFPFFTLYLVSSLAGFNVNRFVFAIFFWLGYFNSALNPISYAAFNQDFRGAFKRLLKIK